MESSPGHRLRVAITRIAEHTQGRMATGLTHDDADGAVGTIASDDAVGFDPMPVLRAIAHAGANAVVIGQVAGILHGSTELTGDLDLLWSGDPRDAGAMGAAFNALGAELLDDSGTRLDSPAQAFSLPKTLFRTPFAAGDCCTPRLPWGDMDVAAFLGRAISAAVEGAPVRYLAMDDLIAMRRAASRPKDLRRITELERLAVASPEG